MTPTDRFARAAIDLYKLTNDDAPEAFAACREFVAAERELTGAASAYDEQLARDRDAAVADLRAVAEEAEQMRAELAAVRAAAVEACSTIDAAITGRAAHEAALTRRAAIRDQWDQTAAFAYDQRAFAQARLEAVEAVPLPPAVDVANVAASAANILRARIGGGP